jgi:Amiloride-sensitive sodium channel
MTRKFHRPISIGQPCLLRSKTRWTSFLSTDAHGPRDDISLNFNFFSSSQLARFTLFFKEGQFITSKRSELYGRTDFLANCGGLLGLFMGVSLISILEILYFCTIRLACNLRMRARRTKKQNRLSPMPSIVVEKSTDKDHFN